jgi:hypothetical protein
MAQNPFDDLTKVLKDVLYVGVGLGVVAVQRAQVQRQELRKQLAALTSSDPQAGAHRTVDDRMTRVEERLAAVEERVEATLDSVEALLPAPVQDVSKQVRAVAKGARDSARQQVRELVGRVNGGSAT